MPHAAQFEAKTSNNRHESCGPLTLIKKYAFPSKSRMALKFENEHGDERYIHEGH